MDLFNDLPEPKSWFLRNKIFYSAINEIPLFLTCLSFVQKKNKDTTESQATDELNENRKRESTEPNERSYKKLNNTVGEKQIGSLSFRGYFAERQGERETMEDRHVIIEDYKKYLNNVPSDLWVFNQPGL